MSNPYSPHGRFFFASSLPSGNSSLASYFASKILTPNFDPLPLGISNDLPWGVWIFLELHKTRFWDNWHHSKWRALHHHCYGNSWHLKTNEKIKIFDHRLKRWDIVIVWGKWKHAFHAKFKTSTPRPEKPLRASLITLMLTILQHWQLIENTM